MKRSRFNVFFDYNGKTYISNTFSKSLIELDEQHQKVLANSDAELCEIQDSLKALYQEGILVDDQLDEIGMLRFAHEQSKKGTDEIEIVVAPTLSCNFRCEYCFETKRNGRMSDDVQDKVINYIKEKTKAIDCKKIRFIWFGGEPLLCFDIIEKMTVSLNKYCQESGINIEYSVITNGYLITHDILARMEQINIRHVQITLDGDKNTHDSRRVLLDGSGTYDKIYDNLKLFSEYNITVAIRVNIDADNAEMFGYVKSEIKKLNNNRIVCHPALVEKTENQSTTQKNKCLKGNEDWFYKNPDIEEYYLSQSKKNLDNVCCVCSAEHLDSFVVDELGNLYKCWNSIGYDDQIWGTIGTEKKNPVIVSQYLGRDPFTENECCDCAFIPVCAGGCIYHSIYSDNKKCIPEKFLYDKLIIKKILKGGNDYESNPDS